MILLKDFDEMDARGASNWADGDGEGARLSKPAPQIEIDVRPNMLVIGAQDGADQLVCWGERAGLRSLGRIALDAAVDRLSRIASLDLLLLDLRGVDVLARLDRATALTLAARHGFAQARLVVIVDMDGLDCALAMLDAQQVEFLCDPDDSEIVSMLVMAGLRKPAPGRVLFDDASREGETARLEQLSEEVRRLATTIERMSVGIGLPAGAGAVMDQRGAYRAVAGGGDLSGDPARLFQPRERHRAAEPVGVPTHSEIRALIRARRMRDQFFPPDLFADPAWDMVLDLLAARLAGQRVSVSSLCIAAAVPPTTALRWIRQLTDRSVFARIDDPADGRRVFIELTETAAQAVLSWAQTVRRNGGLLVGAQGQT